jgi:hypothetical protein
MITPLDHYLLRAYLVDELDEAATEAFELLMIERPELAELAIADTTLGIGLTAEAAAGRLPPVLSAAGAATATPLAATQPPTTAQAAAVPLAPATPPREPPAAAIPSDAAGHAPHETSPRRRLRRHSAVTYLAAAAILLAIGAGLGLQRQSSVPMLGATSLGMADTLRSSGLKQIRLPATGLLTLSVPVLAPAQCSPLLLHLSQSGQSWETATNPPDDDYVYVTVDPRRLSPGEASIRLTCAGKEIHSTRVAFTR